MQNFQADLAVLLAEEGADIEQAICTDLKANLDVMVETADKPSVRKVDLAPSVFFAQDAPSGWGDFKATIQV